MYHHFFSKEDILDRIVDAIQAEIAVEVLRAAQGSTDVLQGIGLGTHRYLTLATAPGIRRILLVEGPAVAGNAGGNRPRTLPALIRTPLNPLRGRMGDAEVDAVACICFRRVPETALPAA